MSRFDFTPLRDELRIWRDNGRRLSFWIRDDDAVAPTAELEQLLALTARFCAPLALAVIPQDATDALAQRLRPRPEIAALPHGWAHRSHAQAGAKKAEFGADRPLEARREDATRGWRRISTLFGAQATPIFTPPWNRAADDLFAELPAQGLRAVSTFGPRSAPEAARGLLQLNTHLDPIDWRGTRSLHAPETLINQMTADLAARRIGRTDATEPYGLLTHHLVHDAAIWSFCAALLEFLRENCETVDVSDIRSFPLSAN